MEAKTTEVETVELSNGEMHSKRKLRLGLEGALALAVLFGLRFR